MVRVLLVRHGESEWNALGRWQGWADPPLSPRGHAQARAAVAYVGAVDVVASSDLRRAADTAAIIAEAVGVGPVVVDAGLRERDAGPWTGLTRAEIDERWPGALEAFEPPAGFEGDDSVLARARPALLRLAALGDTVLAIAHGGVIGVIERHVGCEHVRVPNLGGRAFLVDGEAIHAAEPVLLLGDEVPVTAPPEV